MGGAVNPNTPHSLPICAMFNKIVQYLRFFPQCHDNDNSIIMMTSSSKFCAISWRGRFKSWPSPCRKTETVGMFVGSKYGSWQYCQKTPFKTYFPIYVKPFVSLFLSSIFFFVAQIRKTCTKRNKILNLWSLIINCGTQFLIPTDWIIEKVLCHILCAISCLGWFFCSLTSCPKSVKNWLAQCK